MKRSTNELTSTVRRSARMQQLSFLCVVIWRLAF